MSSDTSSQGWDAKVTWVPGFLKHYSGTWSGSFANKHINIKKLKTAINLILDNPSSFSYARIRNFSDNKCTVKSPKTPARGLEKLVSYFPILHQWHLSLHSLFQQPMLGWFLPGFCFSVQVPSLHPGISLKQARFDSLCLLLNSTSDINSFANSYYLVRCLLQCFARPHGSGYRCSKSMFKMKFSSLMLFHLST